MASRLPEPLQPTVEAASFFAIDIRLGKVVDVQPFPEARKPAYKVWVDFGPEVGTLKTSAQITVHYAPETLLGRMVLGWVNAPAKQVGPFTSQFLLLGFHDDAGSVMLAEAPATLPLGARLC